MMTPKTIPLHTLPLAKREVGAVVRLPEGNFVITGLRYGFGTLKRIGKEDPDEKRTRNPARP